MDKEKALQARIENAKKAGGSQEFIASLEAELEELHEEPRPQTAQEIEPRKQAVEFVRQLLARDLLAENIANRKPSQQDFECIGNALEQAAVNPDTNDFDVLIGLAAEGLRGAFPMPPWLAVFAADVLEGKRKRPTKRGPDRYITYVRDYNYWYVTQKTAQAFDLPMYTSNELSVKTTAADIVAEAEGCNIETIKNACKRFADRGKITT